MGQPDTPFGMVRPLLSSVRVGAYHVWAHPPVTTGGQNIVASQKLLSLRRDHTRGAWKPADLLSNSRSAEHEQTEGAVDHPIRLHGRRLRVASDTRMAAERGGPSVRERSRITHPRYPATDGNSGPGSQLRVVRKPPGITKRLFCGRKPKQNV